MTRSRAKRPTMPSSVTWRVSKLRATEDHDWELAAISDHPNGDWPKALTVARTWFGQSRDEIEQGQLQIKVDPVAVR
jgi:hypothetical protein